MVNADTILQRLRAAGIAAELLGDGRILTRGRRVPDELRPLLRQHRAAVAAELRRRSEMPGSIPLPSASTAEPDAKAGAGSIEREGELLLRVHVGLGHDADDKLWHILDRALAQRDLPLADLIWQRVVDADRRGNYSRLAAWLQSLARAGEDMAAVRRLVDTGPGLHPYHDAR